MSRRVDNVYWMADLRQMVRRTLCPVPLYPQNQQCVDPLRSSRPT